MLLHGHGGHHFSMRTLGMALTTLGYATTRLGYPSLTRSLSKSSELILPEIETFAASFDGPLHFVGHSFGGLMIRAVPNRARPPRLGRVVMIGTPNAGSEVADGLRRAKVDRLILGPAGGHLLTVRTPADLALLGEVDYPVGVIAGTRASLPKLSNIFLPLPNDGKVSVAATHVLGETDHVEVPVAHFLHPYRREVIRQATAFLQNGRFDR